MNALKIKSREDPRTWFTTIYWSQIVSKLQFILKKLILSAKIFPKTIEIGTKQLSGKLRIEQFKNSISTGFHGKDYLSKFLNITVLNNGLT